MRTKPLLFTPLDQDDFVVGNHGASYLNEVIYLIIEKLNYLASLEEGEKCKNCGKNKAELCNPCSLHFETTESKQKESKSCCEKCEIYLDYKDAYQCSDGECECHKQKELKITGDVTPMLKLLQSYRESLLKDREKIRRQIEKILWREYKGDHSPNMEEVSEEILNLISNK